MATSVRNEVGTPPASSRPGRLAAPKTQLTVRFIRAVAASLAGRNAAAASKASQPLPAPAALSAHSPSPIKADVSTKIAPV